MLAFINEAEKVEPRSTSREIEANRKKRRQLEVQDFKDIHEQAEEWLQLAMKKSLMTLQSRNEVCNAEHTDFRNDFLFVIRDKVAGDSKFIKISSRRRSKRYELAR